MKEVFLLYNYSGNAGFRIVEELLSEITGFSSETAEFYILISCSFFHNIFYFLLFFSG